MPVNAHFRVVPVDKEEAAEGICQVVGQRDGLGGVVEPHAQTTAPGCASSGGGSPAGRPPPPASRVA